MKIWEAISMACVCGLKTIDEAVMNIEHHAISLMPWEKINEELHELYEDAEKFKAAFGDDIPDYFQRVEDKILNCYFDHQCPKEPDDSEEITLL